MNWFNGHSLICYGVFVTFSCSCFSGYGGQFCENVLDSCYTGPCHNGGNCTYTGVCSCQDVVIRCGW